MKKSQIMLTLYVDVYSEDSELPEKLLCSCTGAIGASLKLEGVSGVVRLPPGMKHQIPFILRNCAEYTFQTSSNAMFVSS